MNFEKKDFEKEFQGKTIMITGGLGFIGSNLAHKLINLNPKKIIIIDNLIPNHGGSIYNVKDILDRLEIPFLNEGGLNINDSRVASYLNEADYIFNIAGSVSHIDSKNKPFEDLEINLSNHVAFLETCRKVAEKTGRKFKILFTSTRDIYGKTSIEDLPVKEDFIIKEATDPQGIHNYSAEYHHLWHGKTSNLPVTILRLSNTYGPRQKISEVKQGFLGHFIYKVLSGEEIELWDGGKSLRDFNYVEDVIEAMLMAMASDKSNWKIYNLGSFVKMNGRYYEIGNNICSVGDAARSIINIAGTGAYKDISYPKEKKNIEPGHVYLDATKIYYDFGWFPKTSFEEGLKKTIDFYKENQEYLKDYTKIIRETSSIQFLDLKKHHELLKEEIELAIDKIIKKSNFILGSEVENFEQEFSSYCNKKYGIGVNSGTDALKLSLMALNISYGDEVIIPANTAIPTAMAVKDTGAEPCFVDVNEAHLIDVNKIELAINKKTKVIMPVHLYGQSCEMGRILEIARNYNLKVIEDCCQAHGTLYNGKKVPITHLGCFSFYPSKNLGALGDGGMVVTNNEEIKNKLVLLRNYGQSSKYQADIFGINSRLDELQATVLRVKLKHLDNFNEKRRQIAFLYNDLLKELDSRYIKIPDYNSEHIYHLYVIRAINRDSLINYLKEKEIGTLIHYPIPLHLQKSFSYLGHKPGDFPNTEKFSKEILSLPMFPELTEQEVRRVCQEIKNFYVNY